ncbi:MAG: putative phosphohydrolase [bacterium]|jgi:predicted phosphohydrolase
MKIWAISDTHLSHNDSRTMNQFGDIWINHPAKIMENWSRVVSYQDIVFVTGDLSWSYKLEHGLIDLRKLHQLPGKSKVIVKGNHDIWWKKLNMLQKSAPASILPLQGTAIQIGDQVICGTRGWISPNDVCSDPLDKKTFLKEMDRLEKALEEAMSLDPKHGIHLLLHFPPFTTTGAKTAFFDLLKKYPVVTCTYGHFHMEPEWEAIPKGMIDGTFFQLASTDYLNHTPVCIWDTKTMSVPEI